MSHQLYMHAWVISCTCMHESAAVHACMSQQLYMHAWVISSTCMHEISCTCMHESSALHACMSQQLYMHGWVSLEKSDWCVNNFGMSEKYVWIILSSFCRLFYSMVVDDIKWCVCWYHTDIYSSIDKATQYEPVKGRQGNGHQLPNNISVPVVVTSVTE